MRGLHSGLAMATLVLSAGVAHPQSNVGFRDDPLPERRRRIVPTRYNSSGGPWPHNGAREIARRLRQAARNAERQAQRFYGDGPRCLGVLDDDKGASYPVIGNSRRGRMVLGPALSA